MRLDEPQRHRERPGSEVVNPINSSSSDAGASPRATRQRSTRSSSTSSSTGEPWPTAGGEQASKTPGRQPYNGALSFTKGSGGNGVRTRLHGAFASDGTDAASADHRHRPGFSTDSAKVTGRNYTPFAVFFANANPGEDGRGLGQRHRRGERGVYGGRPRRQHLAARLRAHAGLIGHRNDRHLTGSDGPWGPVTTLVCATWTA